MADKKEIEAIINDLEGIRARKFLEEEVSDSSPYGPADVKAMVWLKGKAEPQVISVGTEDASDPGHSDTG